MSERCCKCRPETCRRVRVTAGDRFCRLWLCRACAYAPVPAFAGIGEDDE